MKSARPARPMRRDELRKFKNIVVVFGSRDYTSPAIFDDCMVGFMTDYEIDPTETVFVSGMAPNGPDKMIVDWCKEKGYAWHECPADWDNLDAPGARIKVNPRTGKKYNALAGFVRNGEMANISTHGLGFWDGKSPGTADMIKHCKAKESMKFRLIRVPEVKDGTKPQGS